jgi:5'(3')-deoxyribonucleotidase
MTKYLLTDIDDTIVSFNSQYVNFLEKEGHIELCPTTHEVTNVTIDLLANMDMLSNKFQESRYFSDLKPFECASKVLPIFKNHGYKIVGISAAQNNYVVLRNRNKNMQRYFPNLFDGMFHVNSPENKKQILQKFPESIWVEDLYDNAKIGVDCGHRSYHLLHGSSPLSFTDGIFQVDNWSDICKKELGIDIK